MVKPLRELFFSVFLFLAYMGTVGPPGGGSRGDGGGVKLDFRKTSFLSVSRRNFFLKFQGGSPRVKKGV